MSNRRFFLKRSVLLGTSAVLCPILNGYPFANKPQTVYQPESDKAPFVSDFVLWQLPLNHAGPQGNAYVFRTTGGKVIVMDGGIAGETEYLRGFLGPLGNEVEAWFISHPHGDHIGVLNEILKAPKGIKIKSIYHSEFSRDFYETVEPESRPLTEEFYARLKKTDAQVVDVTEPGLTVEIDHVQFRILAVKNEKLTVNAYNNSSMVIRVSDAARSVLFLGDAGVEEGNEMLNGVFRKELDCDYLQMAHHGQQGVSREFYRSIRFKACLWPTPLWLWNNDTGAGFNSGPYKTLETRAWMEELGIQKHFVMAEGLCTVE
jgi:hypothetical protein